MDMKQLEFFVTACERGSLSKAAECLYTSQPNISKNIRSLERELGRPLLKRSGTGVQPTVYGKTVLEYARLILKNAAAISSMAVPEETNSLCISAYPSNMVARLLVDFYRQWGEDGAHLALKPTVRLLPGLAVQLFHRQPADVTGFRRLESSMWH